jgi:hypothetical protein
MRAVIIGVAAVVGLLAVVPLAVLVIVWVAQGFGSAAAWAAIYLLIWAIIFTAVPLAILVVVVFKGAPLALGKVGSLFGLLRRLAVRLDTTAVRASDTAVRPSVWLYAKAAWLSGVAQGLRRQWLPRRS